MKGVKVEKASNTKAARDSIFGWRTLQQGEQPSGWKIPQSPTWHPVGLFSLIVICFYKQQWVKKLWKSTEILGITFSEQTRVLSIIIVISPTVAIWMHSEATPVLKNAFLKNITSHWGYWNTLCLLTFLLQVSYASSNHPEPKQHEAIKHTLSIAVMAL